MRKVFAILLLGLAAPALAQVQTVKAVWKHYAYDGPRYRGWDCIASLNALDDLLWMMEARRKKSQCSWNWGLQAEWEALTPVKDQNSRSVARFLDGLERQGGWLSGLGEKWKDSGAPEEPAEALWARANLQRSMNDTWACNIYANTLDYLLDRLPVRNVNQMVFCQTGTSFISLSFDYLKDSKAEEVVYTARNSPKACPQRDSRIPCRVD